MWRGLKEDDAIAGGHRKHHAFSLHLLKSLRHAVRENTRKTVQSEKALADVRIAICVAEP